MATLSGGEAWDLYCELSQAKSWTQLSTHVSQTIMHKVIDGYDFNDI